MKVTFDCVAVSVVLASVMLHAPRANAQIANRATAGAEEFQATGMQSKPPTGTARMIEGLEMKLGDRSIFYRRVEPPAALSPRASQPKPQAKPFSPAQMAVAEARARKKFEPLTISATVYDRRVTELRWWAGNREYRAWSNVDFNLLAGVSEIETDAAVYWLIMGVGNETAESIAATNDRASEEGWEWHKELPSPMRFDPTRAQFLLQINAGQPEPPAEALAAIDALHRYYDVNRGRVADEHLKREAANAERAKWLKEHPPRPRDTVINFWPKKSRNYRALRK